MGRRNREWVWTGPHSRSLSNRTRKHHVSIPGEEGEGKEEDLWTMLTDLWLLLSRGGLYSSSFSRAHSHQMLSAQWGNKPGVAHSDVLRCFTEKSLLEQLLNIFFRWKEHRCTATINQIQWNNKIIAKSHTEHWVQACLVTEWTEIILLADQTEKWKRNPRIFHPY